MKIVLLAILGFCGLMALNPILIEKGYNQLMGRVSINPTAMMSVRIDAGWYSFAYGSTGTMAYRSFQVCNRQVAQLFVTSCFCYGNAFSVFDNGQPVLTTDSLTVAPTCTTPVTVPQTCADDVNMSQGSILLLPGIHNITIVPILSPWNGGTAFLRVDTACPNIDFLQPPVPCCEAFGTCSNIIMA